MCVIRVADERWEARNRAAGEQSFVVRCCTSLFRDKRGMSDLGMMLRSLVGTWHPIHTTHRAQIHCFPLAWSSPDPCHDELKTSKCDARLHRCMSYDCMYLCMAMGCMGLQGCIGPSRCVGWMGWMGPLAQIGTHFPLLPVPMPGRRGCPLPSLGTPMWVRTKAQAEQDRSLHTTTHLPGGIPPPDYFTHTYIGPQG